MTETFVAAKLYVDNWRWADTPFYLRTGKRLAQRETTIAIQFKRAPHPPFEERRPRARPNVLLSTSSRTRASRSRSAPRCPGQGMTIRTVHMDFLYGGAFRTGMPEAYERLILDAMLGDATLFTRADEVEEQWQLVDAIVAAWKRDRPASRTTPRARGGRRAPTSCSPATAGRGAGIEAARPGRATTSARDSSASSAAPGAATSRGPEHADARAHARGLGAAGVGGGGGARSPVSPSGTRRARSCSSPTRTRTDRIDARASLDVRVPGRRAARAPRCSSCACAAGGRRRRRASSRRSSSPTCRSFCAGAAGRLGHAGARAAGRPSSTG